MAVDLGKLVAEVKENISIGELDRRRVAIDAFNTIYQFISIIRGPDGTPLTDSKGRVTSHLSGLFYRTTSLLEQGVIPIYVFDGAPPVLKQRTLEARANKRVEAQAEWEKARAKGQLEEARAFAVASSKINKWMIDSSKELLTHMGVPYIQAPSEGEAQAAMMVREKIVYAAASQDYDLFLFGADVIVRNLTITGKRKLPGKGIYINVEPERIYLKKLLESLKLTREQLIWMGMLIGTDFNEGIEKVGPKTALKIVNEHKSLGAIEKYVKEKYNKEFEVDPEEVEAIFMKPEALEIGADALNEKIAKFVPSKEAILKFMCDEHEFSVDRITKGAERLVALRQSSGQKGINSWL
ncbi:MAG: flap endonuclease-1 [Candidatus Micrarchaeota archaeon]|nr:flap endonuclease-1 [Candidatus Micrarchaeota archaeon]